MNDHVVYFAHGKESGPWGIKIERLAQVARAKGFHVESPDYSAVMDPDQRVEELLTLKPEAREHLVLAGSSMGGYVSAAASKILKPAGLFLLAPAVFREGYRVPSPKPVAGLTTIVHGWEDIVIPVDDVFRYAREHGTRLVVVNSNHRLLNVLPVLERLFAGFLDEILQG